MPITNYLSKVLLLFVLLVPSVASAQMSRKPTPTREPAGAMDKTPDSKKNSLVKVTSREEFNTIARTYHQNTPYALPHAMFVIDRRAKNKIYFVNSQRFRFHKDFLLATYLVPRGADIFKPIYIDLDRRFIVGTVAYQKTVDKWTWELWEGDLANAELMKAANQGEIVKARVPGIILPDGFSIPFYWYDAFMKQHGFDERIADLMEDLDFVHNPRVRREKLEQFRNDIQKAKFDDGLRTAVIQRWKTQLGGRPVFVRSSSNAEDLPKFSGAGLYSSVPNVREADKLVEAVKKVWASLWKFEAYEARVRNYVDQKRVYMSALVQLGVDMQKGGVMITKDPFDEQSKDSVYISAVCGHNSKIPDNSGLPEQILFNPKSNSVVVMTLSQLESSLEFDESGGLKETSDKCANASNRVLTDLQARNLARTAIRIRGVFGKEPQDIEWGILNGRVYIVQARPYID